MAKEYMEYSSNSYTVKLILDIGCIIIPSRVWEDYSLKTHSEYRIKIQTTIKSYLNHIIKFLLCSYPGLYKFH